MSWLLKAGGAPSFVTVVFGLVALVAAARFAWRPEPGRLAYIGGLGLAVLFASLAGVAADLAAVAVNVAGNEAWASSPELPVIVLMGFGESMAPAILGFSVLSVVALVSAVGLRRMA